ncbi:MAG: 4Fe-4S dicluster domain-containing protein [Bacillota bacterium]
MADQPKVKIIPKRLRPVKIKIDSKLCKRCGTCSAYCPRRVLAPGVDGIPEIINQDLCTGCQRCFYRCPDFAIVVEVCGTIPVFI